MKKIFGVLFMLLLSIGLYAQSNLALNWASISSSRNDDGQPASNAIDGNGNSRWESRHGQDNVTLTLTFIQKVYLTTGSVSWENASASSYNVEYSEDNLTWRTIFTKTNGNGGYTDNFTFQDSVKYVRINCLTRSTPYGFSIFEIVLNGFIDYKEPTFTTKLPVIYINQPADDKMDNSKNEVMCDFKIIYDKNNPDTELEVNSTPSDDPNKIYLDTKAMMHVRGQTSKDFPKKPYAITLYDAYGVNKMKKNLFKMGKENDWILYAAYNDKSLMRNKLIMDMYREMGHWASEYQYCEVYLDGVYQGVYMLMEKYKRDNTRIDVQKVDSVDKTKTGYIFTFDKTESMYDDPEHVFFRTNLTPSTHSDPGNQWHNFEVRYPKNDDYDYTIHREAIKNYVQTFETALHAGQYDDVFCQYLDVETALDYMLINEFTKNVDAYRISVWMTKDYDKKLAYSTIWDYDLGLANSSRMNASDIDRWLYSHEGAKADYYGIPVWYEDLMNSELFQNLLKTRWNQLKNTVFSVDSINNEIDAIRSYLDASGAIERNFEKWKMGDINANVRNVLGDQLYVTNYDDEIALIKNYVSGRVDWLEANLPGTAVDQATYDYYCVAPDTTNTRIVLPNVIALGENVSLIVTAKTTNANYQWYKDGVAIDGATSSVLTFDNITKDADGAYSCYVVNCAGKCTTKEVVVEVDETAIPDCNLEVGISVQGQLNCTMTSVNLVATANEMGVTYTWTGSTTGSVRQVSNEGTYVVSASNAFCVVTASASVVKDVTKPTVSILGAEDLTCLKTNVVLSASSSQVVDYVWVGAYTSSSLNVTDSGTYSVLVTNVVNGCTVSDEVTINENKENVLVSISGNSRLNCLVNEITLTANSNQPVNYVWNGDITTNTKRVTAAGVNSVVATYGVCSASASVSVSAINTMPTVKIESPIQELTCSNSVAVLSAVAVSADRYEWDNYDENVTRNVINSGIYSVKVINQESGCSASASIEITENKNLPEVTIGNRTKLSCSRSDLSLTAFSDDAVSYVWSTGETGSSIIVTKPMVLSVEVTGANGCKNSDEHTVVDAKEMPSIDILGEKSLDCFTTAVVLTASSVGANAYKWSNETTTSEATFTHAGEYSVTVTNGFCKGTVSFNISDNSETPSLNVSILGEPKVGNDVTLSVVSSNIGYAYQWKRDDLVIGTDPTLVLSDLKLIDAGTYSIYMSKGRCLGGMEFLFNVNAADAPEINTQPINQLAIVGQNVTFSIETEEGCTYQWYKNNQSIDGATNSTYVISNVSKADDNAQIYCDVTKNGTTAKSNLAYLTVRYAAPNDVNIIGATMAKVGDPAIILTASTTAEAASYKWSNGDTSSTKLVSTAATGTYVFSVTVTNESGSVSASHSVTINPADPPIIYAQPENKSVSEGVNVEFSVNTEAGCTYQWYKNGELVAGATSSVYRINNVTKLDNGSQVYCDVTKNGTTAKSNNATLTVSYVAPSNVAISPASTTVKVGDANVTLRVIATGKELIYRWSDNTFDSQKVIVPDAVNTYTYTVTVSNDGGSVTASASVNVIMADAATIYVQPQDKVVKVGENADFSVSTEAGCTYQWYKNGVALPTEKEATISISNVDKSQDGDTYYCVVTKNGTSISTDVVTLTVKNQLPTNVTIELNKTTIVSGDEVMISAQAMGVVDFYQWYKNNVAIPGATEAILTYSNITKGDEGLYYCEVSNDGGSAKSNSIEIKILPSSNFTIVANDEAVREGDTKTYSVSNPEEGVSYLWKLEDGTILSENATQVDVTWSVAGNQKLIVVPSNESGSGTEVSMNQVVKPASNTIQIETLVSKEEVNVETAYMIKDSDTDAEYIWEVVGGKVLDGQGGDVVRIIWETAENTSIAITPIKNGIEGDKVIFNREVEQDGPVALNDESVRLTIYPNPTTDFVNIDINEEVNSIKIYDISGRIIRSFVNEVNNLYLGDLNKGVYIIQVQTENKLYQNQLVLY